MSTSRQRKVARRKRRIERRLRPRTWTAQATPMCRAHNIQYEHSDRVRGLTSGGIGAMHQLAQHTGLVEAIDQHVEVLTRIFDFTMVPYPPDHSSRPDFTWFRREEPHHEG